MIGIRMVALGAAGLLALAACGGSSGASGGSTSTATGNEAAPQGFTPPDLKALDKLGTPEGSLNIVAWAGYVEDGSADPAVDWVTPFEDLTGCAVNTQLGNTSDEMVQLMQSGEYDGVSASGDATERLMAGDEVGPIDVAEFSSYPQIFDDLK